MWQDLRDPEYKEWQIRHYNLYPLLGIPAGGHLPKEGFPERIVTDAHGNQAVFKCEPATGRHSKHRLFYNCEVCAKWIPFGRAFQHRKGREHRLYEADLNEWPAGGPR
jgi:hypothetical protein